MKPHRLRPLVVGLLPLGLFRRQILAPWMGLWAAALLSSGTINAGSAAQANAGASGTTAGAANPQQRAVAEGALVTLQADQQRETGKVFFADGHVDITYQDKRLRGDHAEYNDNTHIARITGHVQFDYQTEHLEASDGSYNLITGAGAFHNVRGTFTVERRPSSTLLISQNPVSFTARAIHRVNDETYTLQDARITVCDPEHPKWTFHARRARLHVQKSLRLEGATFRLVSVPIIYLPYATVPVARRVRQSGFLIPDVSESSVKGVVIGDSYYWAPTAWMDATVGGAWLSKRGYSQNESLRMRPTENSHLEFSFYGVTDYGLAGLNGTRQPSQGGHEFHVGGDALLGHGWRAVADLNELSSLTFRLVFSETFAEAVNSEVHNNAFVTNNFRGFSVNIGTLGYENFFTAAPQTLVTLRTGPGIRAGSVDQSPWKRWPVYFGFGAFADGVYRDDETASRFQTPLLVPRLEVAPRVTIPLHLGSWLGITPSLTVRATRYGGQLAGNAYSGAPFLRTTEEFSVDLRPPALERVWNLNGVKWEHTIEPTVLYRDVNGVDDFARFIRFDEDETLTDTNEIGYDLTQRLFRREGNADPQELVTWRLAQKYFFDPTFGEALVPGQRNVFQTFDELTPFAFADAPRRFSPIISDLRVTPGGLYDAQFRADYDPVRGEFTAWGVLLKLKPYKESFVSLANFSTINIPSSLGSSLGFPSPDPVPSLLLLPPRSNQVRALVGYGDINRPGWNTAVGFSYDETQGNFQNQVVQLSYNGSCCGLGFEYRRFELGNVRVENQFRVVLHLANIGSAGNLRRQEKIF
jgi:LPS-assembly protein